MFRLAHYGWARYHTFVKETPSCSPSDFGIHQTAVYASFEEAFNASSIILPDIDGYRPLYSVIEL